MEGNAILNKQTLRDKAVIQALEHLKTMLTLCQGATNRKLQIAQIINVLRDENNGEYAKQEVLKDFKRMLFGMNSFTDFVVRPKDKNPFKKFPIEMQIKELAAQLWGLINDGY